MASRDTARLRRNKISAIAGSTPANLWPIIRLQETESSVTNEPIVNCKTRCRSECVCRPGRRVFLVVFSRVWPRAFSLPSYLCISALYSAQRKPIYFYIKETGTNRISTSRTIRHDLSFIYNQRSRQPSFRSLLKNVYKATCLRLYWLSHVPPSYTKSF